MKGFGKFRIPARLQTVMPRMGHAMRFSAHLVMAIASQAAHQMVGGLLSAQRAQRVVAACPRVRATKRMRSKLDLETSSSS